VSVKNASLNYLRKNNLSLPASIDDLSVDHFPLVADPELLLSQRELQQQIREAIEQLPPRCRLIFKLVKEDGLSYREVAAILEISIKTVDSQLCLALKKLAAILQPINI
jgi:RNA polymerase sigma-70 factor (ECF subfamily)